MPKRRVPSERDVEEQTAHANTPSKRARVDDEGEGLNGSGAGPSSSPPTNEKKTKGGDDHEDVATPDNQGDGDEDSEERFEAEYGDAVRASIAAKSKIQGVRTNKSHLAVAR